MTGIDLPEGYKGHATYRIPDAARYWAAALYGVPLGIDWREERQRFSREIALAEMELREHVPIFTEDYWATESLRRTVPDDSWNGYSVIRVPNKVKKTREYFKGPDLAAYAKERGHPGLFGFEEPLATDTEGVNNLGEGTKEGYLFLIGLLVQTYADSGPNLRNPNGEPNQAELLRRLERKAKALMVSMDGLGKTQFNEKVAAALLEVKNRQP